MSSRKNPKGFLCRQISLIEGKLRIFFVLFSRYYEYNEDNGTNFVFTKTRQIVLDRQFSSMRLLVKILY